MDKGYYISYASMKFDETTGISRQEAEHFINAHYQGAKASAIDYTIQVVPDGWLLSGTSPLGARAVISMCKGLRLSPNRLDVTMEIAQKEFAITKADDEDGHFLYLRFVDKVKRWFSKHRPNVEISENAQMLFLSRTVFGSRTARWSVSLEDGLLSGELGISATFQLRQDRVKSGWEWLAGLATNSDSDFELACSELFAACTNTLLSPDFFGVGNAERPYLASDRKTDEKRDWYGTLSAFANKILQEDKNGEGIPYEASLAFLKAEVCNRLTARGKAAILNTGSDTFAGRSGE